MRKLFLGLGGLLTAVALTMSVGCSKAPPPNAAPPSPTTGAPPKESSPPAVTPAAVDSSKNIPEKGAKD